MDWIDQIKEQIRDQIHHLSLKHTLILYMLGAIVVVTVTSVAGAFFCQRWQRLVMDRYVTVEERPPVWLLDLPEGTSYVVTNYDLLEYYYLEREEKLDVSPGDQVILYVTGFLKDWGTILYAAVAIIVTSYLFFRNKMKEPLWILEKEAEKIADHELDYEIHYDCRDEMGRLCSTFDFMRRQLIAGQKQSWEAMEDLKEVQAAFAHDLRTPLTVLNGYVDLLYRYYPQGKISDEKLMSTIVLMREQIHRLEQFGNTMQEIGSVRHMDLKREEMLLDDVLASMRETAVILQEKWKKKIIIHLSAGSEETGNFAWDMVREVFENLLVNSLRYANTQVEVTMKTEEKDGQRFLLLYIRDDGDGFTDEEVKKACSAYYRGKPESDKTGSEENGSHFGIGLYICRQLCELHGGYISLANSIYGGAIVTAVFRD